MTVQNFEFGFRVEAAALSACLHNASIRIPGGFVTRVDPGLSFGWTCELYPRGFSTWKVPMLRLSAPPPSADFPTWASELPVRFRSFAELREEGDDWIKERDDRSDYADSHSLSKKKDGGDGWATRVHGAARLHFHSPGVGVTLLGRVCLRISRIQPTTWVAAQLALLPPPPPPNETLAALLQDSGKEVPLFADVCVACADGFLRAHSAVIGVGSEFFRRLFPFQRASEAADACPTASEEDHPRLFANLSAYSMVAVQAIMRLLYLGALPDLPRLSSSDLTAYLELTDQVRPSAKSYIALATEAMLLETERWALPDEQLDLVLLAFHHRLPIVHNSLVTALASDPLQSFQKYHNLIPKEIWEEVNTNVTGRLRMN